MTDADLAQVGFRDGVDQLGVGTAAALVERCRRRAKLGPPCRNPAAPQRCLAAFDELTAIGLDAFVRRHDPYHDIPLVETLPQPVIDLPEPSVAAAPTKTPRGRGRKKSTQERLL